MARRKQESFEEMMQELSGLVDRIGREDCPVGELEAGVRRAAELIRILRSRLRSTEMSVREVLSELQDRGGEPEGDLPDDSGEDGEEEEDEDEED